MGFDDALINWLPRGLIAQLPARAAYRAILRAAFAKLLHGCDLSVPPTRTPASIDLSSFLGAGDDRRAGLESVCAPGWKATIGVFGSTIMVCSPPL